MEAFKDHPKLKEDYLSEHSVDFMDLIDIFDKQNYSVSSDGYVCILHWKDEFGQEQTIDPDSKALKLYKQFITVAPSEKTTASILATVTSRLNLYASSTLLDFMSTNEIDLSLIGKKKTVLYLIVDDLTSTYDPLIEIFLHQLFQSLVKEAETSPNHCLPVPVHLYLDDFTNHTPRTSLCFWQQYSTMAEENLLSKQQKEAFFLPIPPVPLFQGITVSVSKFFQRDAINFVWVICAQYLDNGPVFLCPLWVVSPLCLPLDGDWFDVVALFLQIGRGRFLAFFPKLIVCCHFFPFWQKSLYLL